MALTDSQIKSKVNAFIDERAKQGKLNKVLLIVPDFTRCFSNAGFITNCIYHHLEDMGVRTDILEALGTHVPMTDSQIDEMYGDIPHDRFIAHNWRKDVVTLGQVPGSYLEEITEGLWKDSIEVQVNRLVMDLSYDLIVSIGQVVPHEVIGMANHSKNIFVGTGGTDMINKSHMVGAVYGMERMMGKDYTPVRLVFDYALRTFLSQRPVWFILTVCTAPDDIIQTHGVFIGNTRKCLEDAVELSQKMNIDFVDHGIKKCVVYLNDREFRSTWLGNKAVYRTRMAIADGGELLILAPGVEHFGEDPINDAIIRKYGYRGRLHTLQLFRDPANQDLRDNMGVAAHLIHGSSDGRFSITYAVKNITEKEIEDVGFKAASYDETVKKYNPGKLKYGYNTMPDGEVIYYIPNPALGLWINKEKF